MTSPAQQPADTLQYTPAEAERVFLENNLGLLAARLDISRADARILQAKAWPNPNFTLDEVNLWATARQRSGETVSPAFPGAGVKPAVCPSAGTDGTDGPQRGKAIRLETDSKALAEKTFMELLQVMRLELRQSAAELSCAQALWRDVRDQLVLTDRLLQVQVMQAQLGNAPRRRSTAYGHCNNPSKPRPTNCWRPPAKKNGR